GVTLKGRLRVVARVPGGLKLHDIARNGRVLLTRESPRVGILGMLHGDSREHDMSFLDYSFAADLGTDSQALLFDEEGEAGGANYTVYLRKADGSPVVRLGEGNALSLSPDGKWALSIMATPGSPFRLLATGTGEPKLLSTAGINPEQGAAWFPDNRRIAFAGSEPGHGLRIYVLDIEGSKPRAITPEGITAALPGFAISPDGRLVAAIGKDHRAMLFPVDGGSSRPINGVADGEFPLRFSPDGRSLYTWKRGEIPARIARIDIESGRREIWKELLPVDPAGVERISNVLVSPDSRGYAYCYARLLSDLFVVEGLK
ncbi:MAG: TolB family protein, partial [Thermoanaerobaculia bacterium]